MPVIHVGTLNRSGLFLANKLLSGFLIIERITLLHQTVNDIQGPLTGVGVTELAVSQKGCAPARLLMYGLGENLG